LDFDRALYWMNVGAQPTDTARAILSYKGVLYKKHLEGGVKKGAFDEAQLEEKFAKWLEEKDAKIEGKKTGLVQSKEEAKKAALLAAKNAPVAEETEAAAEGEVEAPAEAPEATTEDAANTEETEG